MAIIIPFFPSYEEASVSKAFTEHLVHAAWQFAKKALWPEKAISHDEEFMSLKYIREYFEAAPDNKRAFTAFIQRVVLAQRYVKNGNGRYVPEPSVWLNRSYPFGFAGTLSWLQRVERKRKDQPDYLSHIEVLAKGYYEYVQDPTIHQVSRCCSALIGQEAHSLLTLFYNTIFQTNYRCA